MLSLSLAPLGLASSSRTQHALTAEQQGGAAHTSLFPPDERNIWMFWDGDIHPTILEFNVDVWQSFHPTWTVHVLNTTTAQQYAFDHSWPAVQDAMSVGLGVAGMTDLLRMTLLVKHGGIWADVDCVPVGNVEQQHSALIRRYGYVVPDAPVGNPRYQDRQIMSWFLMARKGTPLFGQWLEHAHNYLFRTRAQNLTQLAEDVEDVDGATYKMTEAFGNASIAAFLGVDPRDVGPAITAGAALDGLERQGRWPYFWAFYLFTQTLRDAPDLSSMWQAFRNDTATWRDTRLVTKMNRRFECWQLVRDPVEQMRADYVRGNWSAARAQATLPEVEPLEGTPVYECLNAFLGDTRSSHRSSQRARDEDFYASWRSKTEDVYVYDDDTS